jgi:hypothetical protein
MNGEARAAGGLKKRWQVIVMKIEESKRQEEPLYICNCKFKVKVKLNDGTATRL